MLARLFPEVRSLERHRFLAFFTLSSLILAGQAVGGTAAESLLLSRLGVQALPTAMVAASITTMVGATLYSRWIGRWRGELSFIVMLLLGMAFLAGTIPLVHARLGPVYIALFCFNWLSFTIYFGHFFTLVGDYFDTLAMKRLLPLFTVGATCGEIGGGLSASWVSTHAGAEGLLLLWIAFQGLSAAFLWALRGRLTQWNPPPISGVSRSTRVARVPSGWAYIKRSSLAKSLALMSASLMVINTLVQYLHADIFVRSFSGEGQLASFLGMFVAITNLFELVIAARVTPWMVRRWGVAATNMVQPVGFVLTLLLLSSNYTLVPAMLAWMNRKMVQDALASPARAMLYSAFPARFRGPVRASVDGVFGAGSQAVAGFLLGLLQHQIAVRDLVWVGLVVAVLHLATSWKVKSVYMSTLVDDLSQSRLQLPGQKGIALAPVGGKLLSALPSTTGELPAGSTLQQLAEVMAGTDQARALLALEQLRAASDPLSSVLLAVALNDPRAGIRQAAAAALASKGEPALPHVELYFRAAQVASVEAAYEAVAEGGTALGREMLAQELRLLVREALRHLFLTEAADKAQAPVLKLTLDDHCSRCQRLAFKLLSLLEGEQLMAPVLTGLRFANAAARANAMEVLSNLGDREAAGLLVLLTEVSSREDKLATAARLVPSLAEVPASLEALLERCSHSSAPFVRRAALHSAVEDAGLARLARLKTYDLFAPLSLEELEDVACCLRTERFLAGEPVISRDRQGERLYLSVAGRIEPDVRIFGLTSLLDGGLQRYTVTALETATFWTIPGDHLNVLIARYPEIGLALFRRLARQLKQQETVLKTEH